MSSESRRDVIDSRRRFATALTVSLVAILVIPMWPKGGPGPETARFRFACSLGFFGACAALIITLNEPRSRYMKALCAWRYEGYSEPFERAWRRHLHLLDRVIAWPSWAGLLLVAGLCLRTVIVWYQGGHPGIRRLTGPSMVLLWTGLGGLLAFPFIGAPLIRELVQRRRVLNEEIALADDAPPRRLHDGDDPTDLEANRPVVRTGPGRFRAGGIDWGFDDLYQNVVVFGQIGGGKTVCVLNALLEGLLGASGDREPAGGLILDPKGDFLPKLRFLARQHGRLDDLYVIDPGASENSPRWNPLDTDDEPVEVAGRFMAVMETLGARAGDSSFFHDYARKFLRHALTLLRATNPPEVAPSFSDLGRLARDPAAIRARVALADGADPALGETFALLAEWLEMTRETRDGVIGSITNLIDPFLSPPYDVVFAGRSTLRVGELIDRGKLVHLALPASGGTEVMARLAGALLKIDYLREAAASHRLRKSRPTFLLCDEFQKYMTTGGWEGGGRGDADYFEVTRESNHANIISTHNLHALLKLAPKPEAVWNLLGHCATKVFLRNTDPDTNQYASRLFGETTTAGIDYGPLSRGGRGDWFAGPMLGGVRDQRAARVAPEAFTRLAIPKRFDPRARHAESYVFQGAAAEIRGPVVKRRWPVHPIIPTTPINAKPPQGISPCSPSSVC